jgi:hypothetical protein
MALLGNYSYASKQPGRMLAGNATALASGVGQFLPQSPSMWGTSGAMRNFALPSGETVALELTARPSGYAGSAYMMPLTGGGMSSHNEAVGSSAWTGAIAEGRNLSATYAGSSTFDGTGQLVVSGVGSFSGTSTFTGSVVAALAASGTFAGSSTFTGAIVAKGNILGTFAGSSTFTAIRYATGSLAGSFAPPVVLEAAGFSAYLLDEEDIETGMTLRQALRLITSATGGKVSGAGTTTITFRNALADTADRITATVDSSGNRTAITYDLA